MSWLFPGPLHTSLLVTRVTTPGDECAADQSALVIPERRRATKHRVQRATKKIRTAHASSEVDLSAANRSSSCTCTHLAVLARAEDVSVAHSRATVGRRGRGGWTSLLEGQRAPRWMHRKPSPASCFSVRWWCSSAGRRCCQAWRRSFLLAAHCLRRAMPSFLPGPQRLDFDVRWGSRTAPNPAAPPPNGVRVS